VPPTNPDAVISLRPWAERDYDLLTRLNSPAMTLYLGGPETTEQLAGRHKRYVDIEGTGTGHMFVVELGHAADGVGSVGFWDKDWRNESIYEIGWGVLPEFQGRGIASRATALAIEKARAEGRHRSIHAFPSVENAPSNGICRKLGFTLLGPHDFEYPKGHWLRCNDWRLDLS
jgi:RimJ/RimL family protein N-acetyltransferase